MKYVQPIGSSANDPYLDANPAGGIEGSPVPAAAIEHPMRELVALINAAGLAPTDADLAQVSTAVRTLIQKQAPVISTAGGTADALTAAFTPAITALSNGLTLYVRAAAANTTTTPTFTPASGSIAAKTIVKATGGAVLAGDIAGAGHWLMLQYDQTLDKWVLQNPALQVVAASSTTAGIVELATSAEAAALTDSARALTPSVLAAGVAAALTASGSAPIYASRAWVNFNGSGTVEIRASGNVSSITDHGVGDYTVNFATAMPDANYAVTVAGKPGDSTLREVQVFLPFSLTAGSFRLHVNNGSGTASDDTLIFACVMR